MCENIGKMTKAQCSEPHLLFCSTTYPCYMQLSFFKTFLALLL